MIPKVIHYCWFGGNEKSKSVQKCIESWKKYCPDYEIKEWNEDNFDVNCIPFVSEAYKAGKWAFVSDYARLKIIFENGGVYMDTDVELIKSLDDLLLLNGYAGFEGDTSVATGLGFGAEKGSDMIEKLMLDYNSRSFEGVEDYLSISCPVLNTKVFEEHGFVPNGKKQTVNGITVFPKDYFNPKDNQSYITKISENTYSIHHYDASWKSRHPKLKQTAIKGLARIIGKKNFLRLKKRLGKIE